MENEATSSPVAIYLRDERYGLRAPSLDDAEQAGGGTPKPFIYLPEQFLPRRVGRR